LRTFSNGDSNTAIGWRLYGLRVQCDNVGNLFYFYDIRHAPNVGHEGVLLGQGDFINFRARQPADRTVFIHVTNLRANFTGTPATLINPGDIDIKVYADSALTTLLDAGIEREQLPELIVLPPTGQERDLFLQVYNYDSTNSHFVLHVNEVVVIRPIFLINVLESLPLFGPVGGTSADPRWDRIRRIVELAAVLLYSATDGQLLLGSQVIVRKEAGGSHDARFTAHGEEASCDPAGRGSGTTTMKIYHPHWDSESAELGIGLVPVAMGGTSVWDVFNPGVETAATHMNNECAQSARSDRSLSRLITHEAGHTILGLPDKYFKDNNNTRQALCGHTFMASSTASSRLNVSDFCTRENHLFDAQRVGDAKGPDWPKLVAPGSSFPFTLPGALFGGREPRGTPDPFLMQPPFERKGVMSFLFDVD
jgi:hypothetical protein